MRGTTGTRLYAAAGDTGMDDLTGDSPTIASQLAGDAAVVAGRYRVRARLGRGATKEVYLAYDERLDREVALAIVVGASSAAARARVAREAQVTGRLGDHPNVITVYDTGEHDGLPYLVLRAMTGGSLADLLQRERPSIARVIRLGGEVAAALAHAHAHDVVHRDIKPDNVWLAADGSAAVGDFGIAHLLGAERLTAEGVVVGTVRYLSPEQIRGEEIGASSDLYALGITLYELVTGRPPFTAKDATLVLTQHLTSAPVPPSEHEPAIPDELERLILALLAKQPGQRPSSAAEVAAALTAMGAARPARAAVAADGTEARRATSISTAARGNARRLVSVLAARADIADPEVLHAILDRCAGAIEAHGGTVEGPFGDALVGIFGLTASHGDDALRATRAAVELRAQTGGLRLGLETGEVFLGAGVRGAMMATGAAITAAGRLAERAEPGDILLGDQLRRAVAADADVDPATGRLLELQLEQPALLRPATTPFVGRARELAELRAAFERIREERGCRLVTIAAPPGTGKSRLAGEFLAGLRDEATVLVGRCLAYGEGTTYRALADLVRGLGGDDPRERIAQLLDGDEQAVRGILGAIGLSDEPAQAEETAWALRRLLERLARERPLVVAVEDIHWADPALLELLDHVVMLSGGAPILLVCLTRPELLETRPEWAAPQPNRSVMVLDALAPADAHELAARLGAGGRAQRIVDRAEGNPLFVEQLVAVDEGQDTRELPINIQAVLSARIDRLEAGERALLQHAAVEGRTFHAGTLDALLPEDERRGVDGRLVALARKGLIGGDQPEFPGEDAYRFTHALIREAAYAGLPKLLRAQLHAGVAEWLEGRANAPDEVVGFHLEQACVLASDLGRRGPAERELAARARQRLRQAARAARGRGDPAAASVLLERAIALPGVADSGVASLLPDLGASLFEAGRIADATRVLDDAVANATDAQIGARAQVEREIVRLESDTSSRTEQSLRVADAVLGMLEHSGDDEGRCRAWSLRAHAAFFAGRIGEAEDAWCRAADCARRAGDERELFDILAWRSTAAMLGPTPVDEAIARCEGFAEVLAPSPAVVVWAINSLAVLHAMKGSFERAARLVEDATATLDRLGTLRSSVSHHEAHVELLAGRPDRAEVPLSAGVRRLTAMSDKALLATTAAMLAQAVYAQGRLDEAADACRLAAEAAATDDIVTQVIWRGVQAKVLVRRGSADGALALAHEAVRLIAATDLLSHHGDALLDLADVLRACGRVDEGRQAAREALALYERKGNVAGARQARAVTGEPVPPDG